jgi:hypothetical protein
MVSLEEVAVGFLGSCCVMYGVLGVSVICTSGNCDKAFVSSESGGRVPLTPVIATFYCSLAIIIGLLIIKFRNPASAVAQGISTFGSAMKAQSTASFEMRSFSVRFWVLLIAGLTVVFGLIRWVLLDPLYKCEAVKPEEAPFMFALRSTLQKMEFWFMGIGFMLLALGILFAKLETYYQEGYAKRSERGDENLEDYGSLESIRDKLQQKQRQYQAWKEYFGWHQEQGQGYQPRTEHLQETKGVHGAHSIGTHHGGLMPNVQGAHHEIHQPAVGGHQGQHFPMQAATHHVSGHEHPSNVEVGAHPHSAPPAVGGHQGQHFPMQTATHHVSGHEHPSNVEVGAHSHAAQQVHPDIHSAPHAYHVHSPGSTSAPEHNWYTASSTPSPHVAHPGPEPGGVFSSFMGATVP